MAIADLFKDIKDVKSFSMGDAVFKRGEPGDVLYVVKEGKVDILIGDKVLETVEVGGIVGEMALIESKPRTATVIATTDCELVPIDQEGFTALILEAPGFALEVMRVMANRLRLMDMQVQ